MALKTIGNVIKNVMLVFSFVVSLALVIVLVVLALLIFDIKKNVAEPLVDGLHGSFVGLDEATIDWTIPVRDAIPVVLNIPLETDTTVTLTQAVPLQVSATINLPGVGTLNNAQVNLQLPEGLQLPVHLDLDVPVNEELPVALDVRAVIPLQETQLHDPFQNLRLLFEPVVRILHNLPDNPNQAGVLLTRFLNGDAPDLLAESGAIESQWQGFSQTAGLGYALVTEPVPAANAPVETGIVPPGGIPALDEQMRPELYAQGGPNAVNAQALAAMQAQGIPAPYFNGDFLDEVFLVERGGQAPAESGGIPPNDGIAVPAPPDTTGVLPDEPPPEDTDLGILPASGGDASG